MATSNYKWNIETTNDSSLRVVLLISRNKDNKDVENFISRRKSFVSKKTDEELELIFEEFCKKGVSEETSRMYVSINARDEEKARKKLIHFLIDEDSFPLTSLDSKLAAICAEKNCAKEHKWMFDFDYDDEGYLEEFVEDIKKCDNTVEINCYKTPHGYAVVTSHGFDARFQDTKELLLNKWKDVSLKRDDLLCLYWKTKINDKRLSSE